MSNENEKYEIIKEQVTKDVIAKIVHYSVAKDGYFVVPTSLLEQIKREAENDKYNS
jgi:hypothetical protein